MVQIKSGILKDANGTYKDMIVYQIKGKTYGRKRPAKDGNANSPIREMQNTRMTSVVTLFQSIKNTFLVDSWRAEARRNEISSGYNYFIKKNFQAFSNNYNIGDFSRLTLCAGTLQIPFNMEKQVSSPGTCTITWDTPAWMLNRRGGDEVMAAIIYDDEPFRVEIISNTGATRQDGNVTLLLSRPEVKNVHAYVFFTNENRDMFSESIYFNFCF